jgi:hypothetical protein
MRSSVFGAGLFFCGVFAVAGALAACASGADTDNEDSGSPTPNQQNQDNDSSADETGSGDEIPTSSYGDGGTGNGDEPPGNDDSGLDGGEEAAAVGPTCTAGQTCVDIAPAGWTGYVQLVLQNGDAGTACADPYAAPQAQLAGQTNPDGGPASCGACSCLPADSGVSCSIGLLTADLACIGGPGAPMTPVPQNACTKIDSLLGANGGTSGPTLTTGACVSVGGAVTTPPPPPSSTLATVCGSTADGGGAGDAAAAAVACASTQACAAVPASAAGSPSGSCIYQSGVQPCPTGVAFTAQYVVGGIDDGRGCGCSCGPPSCPTDWYVNAYASSDCSGAVALTLDAGSKCKGGGLSDNSYFYHPSRSGSLGSCEVDDAGPTGSVTIDAGTATTFCCIP